MNDGISKTLVSGRQRWAILAGFLLVSILLTVPASAPADPRYGVSVANPPASRDLTEMGGGGVRYVRLPIAWSDVGKAGGEFDWRRTDTAVEDAARNDIEVVPYLTGVPAWMRACKGRKCAKTITAPPAETDPWLRLSPPPSSAMDRMAHFPDPIKTWQIWDEANPVSRGVVPSSPRGVRGAARRDLPRHRPCGPERPGRLRRRFLHAAGEARDETREVPPADARVDEAEIQLLGARSRSRSPLGRGTEEDKLKSVRKILDASGQGDRGIWVTPIGWASDRKSSTTMSVGTAGQKKRLKQSLRLVRDRFGIDGVFWSRWRDGSGGCGWCGHSGLLSRSGKPKPAWAAYKKFLKTVEEPVEPRPPTCDSLHCRVPKPKTTGGAIAP